MAFESEARENPSSRGTSRSKKSSDSRAASSRTRKASRTETRRTEDGSAKKQSRAAVHTSDADARAIKKRKKTKERASRQFDKQYADQRDAARAGEGAPRAAVYKGEMGSSQRKSTRMQRASQAGPVSAKIDPAGWFSHLRLSSRTAKLVTGAICLVLVCAFLYTPAQQYYQAVRENQRLEAEYAAVSERNAALDAQNDALASDAGMEDAVRQKYGYVVAGEQTAVVSGLSDEVNSSKKAAATVEANVLSSSVRAPESWYTPILDAVFGME